MPENGLRDWGDPYITTAVDYEGAAAIDWGGLRCARNLCNRRYRCNSIQAYRSHNPRYSSGRNSSIFWRFDRMTIRTVWLMALLIVAPATMAAEALLEFSSPQQESRYLDLIDELRCMVCQNQNLADSNAALAQDLRDRTYDMVREGKSDEDIISYMVERYGEFVLYRPPLKMTTMLLWFGPAIFLIIAATTFFIYSRRLRKNPTVELDSEERRQAQQLLEE